MFFTYLRRELRRRMRQAIFIALGLALGIGLVITVTAASAGVKNAQGTVLHSLYGVGTDITVTKAPAAGATGGFGFAAGGRVGTTTRPAAGTKIHDDSLVGAGLGTISTTNVSSVSSLKNVAAAAGGLTLTDRVVTGTVPAVNTSGGSGGFGGGGGGGGGGGSFRSSFNVTSFTVDGVDLAKGELGPLSSAKLSSGRTFTSSDANSNVAVVNSNYATSNKLTTGSTITIANTSFKVIGVVSVPASDNSSDTFIPLARAQTLASMKNEVNTVYVAANSASNITGVSTEISKLLPSATVTNSSDLASEVTGSLASASSLANNLGKWLAIAVLIAAFLLASLLTMSAVSRRVREFGTLKALGWRSKRIVGQVMGEAITIGIIGGAVGVGIGFAGAALISKLARPLSASVGQTTGSATPGGARTFGGGGGGFGGGTGGTGRGGGAFGRLASAGHTVAVHLTATVTLDAVVLAVVLALAGGLIAGMFGGWRAARLRPAEALSRVE
jgi:putative ABC transport system permease protein